MENFTFTSYHFQTSQVDENMQKAQRKDAVKTEKFWFRKNITTFSSPPACTACCHSSSESKTETDCYTLMTVDEIINGKVTFCRYILHLCLFTMLCQLPFIIYYYVWIHFIQPGEFPGLIPLINSYLSGMEVDADTHCSIQQYLKLIQRRASGQLFTLAAWMRAFVRNHKDYK